MTSSAPDPKTFTTWQDAFQYPVPAVRRMEQQLRSNVEENREKLRSLVGGSYRDLLETAARIIGMDGQMERVEHNIGWLGQKCNIKEVEKMSRNFEKFKSQQRQRDSPRYEFASQIAVLRASISVASRLLRTGASSILVAKVLVIARLLHKTCSDAQDSRPLIDVLRNRLTHLRQALLSRIDERVANLDIETDESVQDMCAFVLTTSSTPSDALRHFHQTRQQAMQTHLEAANTDIAAALNVFVRTLRDTQTIFPKRLELGLQKLKNQPLLNDSSISDISELQLEIHLQWISPTVQNFTPWPRHDELKRAAAQQILEEWAKSCLAVFLQGMKDVLRDYDDIITLLKKRKEILELWLVSSRRAVGIDTAETLNELRYIMLRRLEALVEGSMRKVEDLLPAVDSTLSKEWKDDKMSNKQIWDIASLENQTADALTHQLVSIYNGRMSNVTRFTKAFDEWLQDNLKVQQTVQEMKNTRWDDIEVSDDDFELDSAQDLFGKEDPQRLLDASQQSLVSVLKSFVQKITKMAPLESDLDARQAAYLLRILRHIKKRTPELGEAASKALNAAIAGEDIINRCDVALASAVLAEPAVNLKEVFKTTSQESGAPAVALWEGSPKLPTQPSPKIFNHLVTLVETMQAQGADLWNVSAVRVIKRQAAEAAGAAFTKAGDLGSKKADASSEEEKSDVGADAEAVDEATAKLRSLQMLFDAAYLEQAFDGKIIKKSSDWEKLEKAERDRIGKNATDYWKRTFLLFALLS